MDEVSLEDFLLKYDFRLTNDKDIQLTRRSEERKIFVKD